MPCAQKLVSSALWCIFGYYFPLSIPYLLKIYWRRTVVAIWNNQCISVISIYKAYVYKNMRGGSRIGVQKKGGGGFACELVVLLDPLINKQLFSTSNTLWRLNGLSIFIDVVGARNMSTEHLYMYLIYLKSSFFCIYPCSRYLTFLNTCVF